MTESEFGKGLTYCIGLFLAHAERWEKDKETYTGVNKAEMWFNGASDHLYELDTTQIANNTFRKEIDNWRQEVLHWGHGFKKPYPTEKNVIWSIEKAIEFLRRIDKTMLKTKTIKGQWE